MFKVDPTDEQVNNNKKNIKNKKEKLKEIVKTYKIKQLLMKKLWLR